MSSSAPAAPAACWPTGCPQIRQAGAPPRGRRTGRLVLDRHSGRLSLHDRQSTHRLVLQDPARRASGRPLDPLRARPRPRRLLHHQRDDLHARPERGLRLLGLAWQRGMVVGRCAAAVQEGRGLSARRRRDARCGRRAARRRLPPSMGNSRSLARCGRRMRHSENPRVQSRRQLRQRVLPDEPEARRALARHESLSPAGTVASQSHGHHARSRRARPHWRERRAPRGPKASSSLTRARESVSRRQMPKRFWRPAVSARRNCCSSRASDRPRYSRPAASPRSTTLAGVGANLHDHLQIRMQYKVQQHIDAERARKQSRRESGDGPRVCAVQDRAAHDAAVATRRVRQERSGPADREHRMARAAALARQVRRSAPHVSGYHTERVQSAASLARLGPHRFARPGRLSGDQAQLPLANPKIGASPSMPCGIRGASWRQTRWRDSSRRNSGLALRPCQTRNWRKRPANWARRFSTRLEPAGWDTTRWPWWTNAFASAVCRDCG